MLHRYLSSTYGFMGDAIRQNEIRVEYLGASEISISVDTGEVIGVIGANGAGKTTLMRTVMGFLPIDKGEVRFQDHSLTRLTAHSRARIGIGYMPEDRKLVPTLTVEENILLSFWATKNQKLPKRLSWVYEMIPEVTESSARKAMDLSGGQQKLVALARALFCGTKLLYSPPPRCLIRSGSWACLPM